MRRAMLISASEMSRGSGYSGGNGSSLQAELPSSTSCTAISPAISGLAWKPPSGMGM